MSKTKPRILILDTYYQPVLDHIEKAWAAPIGFGGPRSYEQGLKDVLDLQFGTGDGYSHHLGQLGWETCDVIANFPALQNLWAEENGIRGSSQPGILMSQIELFKPDVIFLQALGVLGSMLEPLSQSHFLAGQASCAVRREHVQRLDVMFTSFPHYVDKYGALTRVVFNPLAFDPRVLDGIDTAQPRDIDISFVGGVGNPSHWSAGMNVLEDVARVFSSQFKWWGYGADTLHHGTSLRSAYQGEAWGRDMYRIYSRSKIVINRHGEIAAGYTNNMRTYEATGCGALLVTEQSRNIHEFFDFGDVLTYTTPRSAVDAIGTALTYPNLIAEAAGRAQGRTLSSHTYTQRMQTVSDTLLELLHQ